VIWESYTNWRRHRTIRLGAGLAYYGLFALVPLLSLCLFVAGLIFSQEEVQSFVSDHLADTLDADLQTFAVDIGQDIDGWSTSTSLGIIGLLGLLVAASFVFVAVEDSLSLIFDLSLGHGVENWIRRRLLALGVVLLISLVFVAIIVLQAVTGFIEWLIDADGTILGELADLIGLLLVAVFGTLVLALLLRLMTGSRVPWRYVFVGSIVGATGLAIGGWALGFYYGTIGAASLAAAIGGVLVLLVFMYYAAQILLAAAELTNVLWRRGSLGGAAPTVTRDW
jgi:membrane protein